MKVIFRPREIAIMIVAFLLIGMLRYVTFHADVFNPIARGLKGFSTTDLFYQMMLSAPRDTSDNIVIVDITRLHDRDDIASVLEEIDSLGPSAIDVDVIFERPMDKEGDEHLQEVARKMRNAVFSFRMMDYEEERNEYTQQSHSFFAKKMELTEGFVNVDHQMTRDIPLYLTMGDKTYSSVITQMMRIIQEEPPIEQKSRKIDYTPTVFRTISYDSIQHYGDLIRDHVVMFGGAQESIDMLYTPLKQMHGIEVLCYALKTMIEEKDQTNFTGIIFWILTILFSYLGVCLITAYKDKTASMTNDKLLTDIMRTIFITSIVIFLLMGAFMFIAFLFFVTWNINFDLTPTLSVMALTTTAKDIVCITIKHATMKKH
ncbi:MAG: CHASE2 domain-containing protein [Bacteroidaceae bacterium]|nr:CHASE2 domain-containing protein [Bacteroidaceae bacterium]